MPYKDLKVRREYHKRYQADHPVTAEKQKQYSATYHAKNPEAKRLSYERSQTVSWRRERRYRLTPERYEAVLAEQNNLCAICRKRPPTDVDHCHGTGHFRGLLCRPCNLGIGMFADDPKVMKSAIEYLSRPTAPISERYPQPRKSSTKPLPTGERYHSSKLNDQMVRSIRDEYAAGGISYKKMAPKYGVHYAHIARVVRREIWAHVT